MLYLLTGIGLTLFVVAVAALVGLVRSGQLDDLDTPPARMLAEDVRSPADGLSTAYQASDDRTTGRPDDQTIARPDDTTTGRGPL